MVELGLIGTEENGKGAPHLNSEVYFSRWQKSGQRCPKSRIDCKVVSQESYACAFNRERELGLVYAPPSITVTTTETGLRPITCLNNVRQIAALLFKLPFASRNYF